MIYFFNILFSSNLARNRNNCAAISLFITSPTYPLLLGSEANKEEETLFYFSTQESKKKTIVYNIMQVYPRSNIRDLCENKKL